MSTFITVVKRRPVVAYLSVVFTISWGGTLLVLGSDIRPGSGDEIARLMPMVYLAMMAAPCVGGILLTGLVYGRDGFRELRSRLFTWHVGAQWYALALLSTPVVATAVLLALSLMSPDYLPRIYTSEDKASILQYAIVVAFMVGLTEELGWTGFAIPRLRAREARTFERFWVEEAGWTQSGRNGVRLLAGGN